MSECELSFALLPLSTAKPLIQTGRRPTFRKQNVPFHRSLMKHCCRLTLLAFPSRHISTSTRWSSVLRPTAVSRFFKKNRWLLPCSTPTAPTEVAFRAVAACALASSFRIFARAPCSACFDFRFAEKSTCAKDGKSGMSKTAASASANGGIETRPVVTLVSRLPVLSFVCVVSVVSPPVFPSDESISSPSVVPFPFPLTKASLNSIVVGNGATLGFASSAYCAIRLAAGSETVSL
mmetsp:Transcript_2751/g.10531  ORF Transcript_2751/g.10531 Transcript_2751/m.10531 type:complete len:235 (-) Transcript_2751:286-990(-)